MDIVIIKRYVLCVFGIGGNVKKRFERFNEGIDLFARDAKHVFRVLCGLASAVKAFTARNFGGFNISACFIKLGFDGLGSVCEIFGFATDPNVADDFCVYIIDKDNFIAKTDLNPSEFVLKENTVALIKNF